MAGKKINKNRICAECRKELKVGQRVKETYVIDAIPDEDIPGLAFKMEFSGLRYAHLECYYADEVDGPRYDEEGNEILEVENKYGVKFAEVHND